MNTEKITEKNPLNWREFSLNFDNKTPVLFMLVGLPGSGKSYIANLIRVENASGAIEIPIIHSSDAIREELLHDVNDQNHNQDVFTTLHRRIKRDLIDGKSVIYDATNISKKRRIAFLKELKNISCTKVCVCAMTPYSICLEQNQARERKVPEEAIKKMYLSWCPPSYDEGFDLIKLVYNYGDKQDTYTLYNFFCGEVNVMEIDQENKHHSSTIGQHCFDAYHYTLSKFPDNINLHFAALLHDCGKPFTKSKLNSKGELTDECHYYNHQHCGAYDSLLYLDSLDCSTRDRIYIANLIYYHMMPFLSWDNNSKARDKAIAQIGEDMYNDIVRLHEADLEAH